MQALFLRTPVRHTKRTAVGKNDNHQFPGRLRQDDGGSGLNKNLPQTAVLHWLTCVEESACAAWERFCRAIQKIDAETGNDLLALGLPDEDTKGKIAALLMEMGCQEETWLIIDDFQNIKSKISDTAWNALIEHGAENLHIVILTWTKVEVRVTLKPGVLYLGRDEMRLTMSEIGEYFEQEGVTLTPDEIRWLNRHTEGWIIALNLQKKNYFDIGSFLHTSDIHRMIREIVWDKLTDAERVFLLCVSPFDSYTFRQAAHMIGVEELPNCVKTLSKNNTFIYSDPRGLHFRPHSTLLDFVRGLFREVSENEQRAILTRAGEWCARNKQPEQAMYFYHRLGDYEKILSLDFLGMEFEQSDATDCADILLDILENTTPAEKLTHFISVIKIIESVV